MKISKIGEGNSDDLNLYIKDVCTNLVGKKVDVLLSAPISLTGIVQAYNGNILQLFNYITKQYTYIPSENIVAISSEE